MSMKKRVSLFVCLLNLVPMLNANIRIKAMDPKDTLDLCRNSSSESLKQYEDISLEDKKNMMNEFKSSKNWKRQKEIKKDEYDYQTADSIDIFSLDGGKTNYVLKILPLGEKESFDSENLAYKKLKSCSGLAKNFGVFFPVHVGSYKNKKAEVCYVIYEYAGENKRNSKNLSNEEKIKIWNDIVQKKCRALLFLLSKGIMHCDPSYNNWIIQWEDCKDNDVKVSLIDFGLTNEIDIKRPKGVPIRRFIGLYCSEHKEVLTDRELSHLLDSLSYDLCDLLSIPHYKKDDANYGIFSKVRKCLDDFIKIESEITLGKYKELIDKVIKYLSVNKSFV